MPGRKAEFLAPELGLPVGADTLVLLARAVPELTAEDNSDVEVVLLLRENTLMKLISKYASA